MSLLSPIVKKITIEVELNNDAIDDAIRYLASLKSTTASIEIPKVEVKSNKIKPASKSEPVPKIQNANLELLDNFITQYCTFDPNGRLLAGDLDKKFTEVTCLNIDGIRIGKLMTCWMSQHPEKNVTRGKKGGRCYLGIEINIIMSQEQDTLLDSDYNTTKDLIEDLEFSLKQFYELLKTNKYDAWRCIKDYDKYYVQLKSRGIDITEYVPPADLYRIME